MYLKNSPTKLIHLSAESRLDLTPSCSEMATKHFAKNRSGRKWKTISCTFLLHRQLDLPGDGDWGSEEVKLKLAKYVALVDTAVVIGDFGDSNGEVLQVLAPIPPQTAL